MPALSLVQCSTRLLINIAKETMERSTCLVLTHLNGSAYHSCFRVWLRSIEHAMEHEESDIEVVICCYSEHDFFYASHQLKGTSLKVSIEYSSTWPMDGQRRRNFWVFRQEETLRILQHRSPDKAILTDLDAFWLQSPLDYLFDSSDADLMAQQAGGMPKPTVKNWGFSLCCGFIAIRWSSKVEKFFASWLDSTRDHKDDQWGLNMCLLNMFQVNKADWSSVSTANNDLNAEIEIDNSEDYLHIRACDPSIIGRHQRSHDDSLIFHPRIGFLQRYNNIFYEDVETIHDKSVTEWLITINEFLLEMEPLREARSITIEKP
jgi:hypothetical protein